MKQGSLVFNIERKNIMEKYLNQTSADELKEFFLCGDRIAYSNKNQVQNLETGSVAQPCTYCDSWHSIPSLKEEDELMNAARSSFQNFLHTRMGIPMPRKAYPTYPPTESIIIRSVN
jgi:hypothetical protein